MIRTLTLAAAALLVGAPAFAGPIVTAKVSHNCCGQCDRAITATGAKIAWVGELKSDKPNLAVNLKPSATGKVDVMQAVTAFKASGFPLQGIKVEGAKSLEINAGHLCCEGCAGPLREALGKLKGLSGVQVTPNQPVKATINGTLDASEIIKTLDEAGFSAITFVVQ
jgi:copper chaperone CopZ